MKVIASYEFTKINHETSDGQLLHYTGQNNLNDSPKLEPALKCSNVAYLYICYIVCCCCNKMQITTNVLSVNQQMALGVIASLLMVIVPSK